MRRFRAITIGLVGALAVLMVCGTADARRGSKSRSRGGEFSFRLESGGRSLPTYQHKGYTYVEGSRGGRYAIRVFNHIGERVEAVVTVDGRDVITGREGNYRRQRGYVIEPYGSVVIDGFRTSMSGVAAFRFTNISDSYAARMGNDSNVGVIGVAVFKERRYDPPPRPPIAYRSKKSGGLGSGYGANAPSYDAEASPADRSARDEARQGIGTGYGEGAYSPASQTSFERRARRPDARMAVYYDDHQGLVARGVIRRPPPPFRRPPIKPDPFPYSQDVGFAPPPPAYYWE